MNLVSLADLAAADVRAIWRLAAAPDEPLAGAVGWSFDFGTRQRALGG